MADKLYFYSKSRDVKPGRGTNEHVADPSRYEPLAAIKDWRKILSNFSATCPIRWQGRTFRTIEHAFHYTKIALADPAAAQAFALESGTALARGSGADAQKARKLRKLDPATIRQWDAMSKSVLQQLQAIKLQTCPEYRRVVRLTAPAQLWHVVSRKPAERWIWLERLRDL